MANFDPRETQLVPPPAARDMRLEHAERPSRRHAMRSAEHEWRERRKPGVDLGTARDRLRPAAAGSLVIACAAALWFGVAAFARWLREVWP